ncbi:hypothetical protein JCM11641_005262 [Rhodosporidiobolus odoratus]
MTDTVTISTSDNPPVSLQVSRAHLIAGSKVFADMLSLPTTSDDPHNSPRVQEQAEHFKAFLAVLSGQGRKKGGVLDSLDECGWEKLAMMGDKYDSAVVLTQVQARAWELEAEKLLPLHTFTLATYLGLRASAQACGKACSGRHSWEASRAKIAYDAFKSIADSANHLSTRVAPFLAGILADTRSDEDEPDWLGQWQTFCSRLEAKHRPRKNVEDEVAAIIVAAEYIWFEAPEFPTKR